MNIVFGKTYKDVVTGFVGVATGYCNYISGCNTVLLVPKVEKDNKLLEGNWFDEQRCLELNNTENIYLDNSKSTGGDITPNVTHSLKSY